MSEIIGRVADAVLADLCVRMDIKEFNGAQCDPEIWDEIREAVGRAAIEAMREPTEAMIEAGQAGAWARDHEAAHEVWCSMIDEALKVSPTLSEKQPD